MGENSEKMFQEQLMFLERLKGEVKRDYYVDLFTSSLVKALKRKRKAEGFSQEELALKMGVKQSYISKVESLEKIPTIETIAKYCFGLNFDLNEVEMISIEMTKQANVVPDFEEIYERTNKNWNLERKNGAANKYVLNDVKFAL